jgi:hypothetical protein
MKDWGRVRAITRLNMRFLWPAVLLFVGLVVPALAAPAPRDTLIVPGMRVGPIALGMTPDELNTSVGVPGTQRQEGTATTYSWGELSAQMGQSPATVDTIVVNDGRYETADHLRVGLSALAVVVVLGQPPNITDTSGIRSYEYDGMTIATRNNLIVQIRVHK